MLGWSFEGRAFVPHPLAPSSLSTVYQVRVLFKDHADLLEEFAKFLPDPNADKVSTSYISEYIKMQDILVMWQYNHMKELCSTS